MLVFLGLLFLICGGIMTFQTEAYYDFQQKSRTKDFTTPTPSWIFRTRSTGVVLMLTGVIVVIAQFML